jgi:hypothetical protein
MVKYKSPSCRHVLIEGLLLVARVTQTARRSGYCLEMICADFLAGAYLKNGNTDVLLMSLERFFKFLSSHQQQRLLEMRLLA